MINVCDYLNIDEEVIISFMDGTFLACKIDSVDDPEESELGEYGLSVFTRDGRYIGIGESEISSVEII